MSAERFVRTACCDALASLGYADECYPVIQPNPVFPSVVYYAIGDDSLTLADRGTAMRVESRAKSYGDAIAIDRAIIDRLRKSARSLALLSLLDDFDAAFMVYRRIRTMRVPG